MELEGRLNPALTLPEVLQFLSMGKMTGNLTINHGSNTVSLGLRNGKLVNSSSLGRPRKLGQMFLHRGIIARQALEEALQLQKEQNPPVLLGKILLERRLITPEQLQKVIRLQLEEEMWDLFALQEGTFKFEHGEDQSLGEVLLELDIEPLILEGTRRLDEWARIIKNIPGDEAVPAVRPLDHTFDRELMQFSDNEWRVLSLINGFYNIASIYNRSGVGRFETYRILNSFLASGYVEIRAGHAVGTLPGVSENANEQAFYAKINANSQRHDKSAVGSSSARLMALFRKRNEEVDFSAPKPAELPKLTFACPVSFVAGLSNHVLDELLANSSFYQGHADEQLTVQYWSSAVMYCPKADLVQIANGRLDTKRFERFMEVNGVDTPFRSCTDDTLEALARYLKMIFLLASQRLGMDTAKKIFTELFQSFRTRSTVYRSDEFYFQEYAKKVYA